MADPVPPRILFLSKGQEAASTRYRALALFPILRDAGFDPVHLGLRGGLGMAIDVGRAVQESAVTIVLRRTLTAPARLLLRRAARRLVLDLDDAIYTSPAKPSPARARAFAAMARRCNAVFAGNDTLADAARPYCDSVHTLPTALDLSPYTPADPATLDPRKLVWIGSSSTRPYLEALLPELETAAACIPGLSLRIIADFALRSDTLPIEATPWSSAEEARLLRERGLGLAPLTDNPWTRGKCGFKLIQYMAAGLPTVCDPVGANGQIVEHGRTGLHAPQAGGWAEAIASLCTEPARAAAMGAAGRERAAAHYSVQAVGERYVGLLRGLIRA